MPPVPPATVLVLQDELGVDWYLWIWVDLTDTLRRNRGYLALDTTPPGSLGLPDPPLVGFYRTLRIAGMYLYPTSAGVVVLHPDPPAENPGEVLDDPYLFSENLLPWKILIHTSGDDSWFSLAETPLPLFGQVPSLFITSIRAPLFLELWSHPHGVAIMSGRFNTVLTRAGSAIVIETLVKDTSFTPGKRFDPTEGVLLTLTDPLGNLVLEEEPMTKVSVGQYQHVLQTALDDPKGLWQGFVQATNDGITVIHPTVMLFEVI